MDNDIKKKQSMPFLILNPEVIKYTRRYIWGTDQKALRLFFRLCNMRVYVDGFIDDELDGATIYHKKIYSMKQIPTSESILLLADAERECSVEAAACDTPVVINPAIGCSDLYIYGAGDMGRILLDYLKGKNIVVKGFIDSDAAKVNTYVSGIKVYQSDILRSLGEGTSVIAAGKYYQEIDERVYQINEKIGRYYFANPSILSDTAIYVDQYRTFDGLLFLDRGFENKKIYLRGKDYKQSCQYLELFLLLDFEDICIAKWSENTSENEEICCIEDVLLEENSYIIYCSDSIEEVELERLHKLGLKRGKDYCDIRCNVWEKKQYVFSSKSHGIQILDINLAYTREMGWDFPGIAIYGDNCEEDYKIAVLGGSTSTDGYYDFKCWPSILFEKYSGSRVTIFNAAVEGYASAQELIKLMRDIVPLKPDMVIVFDGCNDLPRDAMPSVANIFEFTYMKTIMEYINGQIGAEAGKHKIFCGIPACERAIEVWLKNIKYMHAVCEINNIKFLSFMQPLFYGKPKMHSKQDAIVHKKWDIHYGEASETIKVSMREFRKRAPEICKANDYIYDLSDILDNEEYMDSLHVFEKGNRIIADEIFKVINDVVKIC